VHSILCGQTHWIEGFMSRYQVYLQPHLRESTLSYCTAQLCFEQKNYRDALRHLSRSHNGSQTRELNIKAWTLKVFYETGEDEAIYHLVDTYGRALKNTDTVSAEARRAQKAFLNGAKKLLAIRARPGIIELRKLEESLAPSTAIHKEWLQEKIAELKASAAGSQSIS